MENSFAKKTLSSIILGALLVTSAFPHPGSGIVVNRQGEVFFTDTGQGVWKIDTKGRLSYVPASLFHWMAIDAAGYFADSEKKFGEWFERVTPKGSKPALIMCSDFPLTMNLDGNLYYADTRRSSARVIRRTPDGKESVLAGGETFREISGISSGPDSSVYIAGTGHVVTIEKITMDGTISILASPEMIGASSDSTIEPPPETETGYCRGLDVDSQGVVYVAATGSRRVLRITPRGEVSTILQAPSPWSPTGVAVFRGDVYVLEWRDAPASKTEVRRAWIPRVRKIARDGKITTLATVSR